MICLRSPTQVPTFSGRLFDLAAPLADDVDFDDDFCFFGVGGIELAFGEGASLFGEVQYRFLEVDGADWDGVDIEGDVEFTGLSFNAGLLFTF